MVEMKSLEEDDQDRFGMHGGGQQPIMGQQQQQQHQQGGAQQRLNSAKRDIIDNLCTSVNQDLLISKTFYFFFFSAFGSLFPLLAVYFKQLGMNPTQSGMLIGLRPFVEFLSAPFWGGMADRYRKGKQMLMFSLFCWIVFTLSLAFIQPHTSECVLYNSTHHILYPTRSLREKRSSPETDDFPIQQNYYTEEEVGEYNFSQETWPEDPDFIDEIAREEAAKTKWMTKQNQAMNLVQDGEKGKDKRTEKNKHKLPPNYVVGKSPNTIDYTLNYKEDGEKTTYVSPPFSSLVYKWADVQEVFFLLLLLVLLGEFFSAPAITLADSVTLTYLSDNADNYGKQRMFGSLGWGLAMFFVGIALDHSTSFPDHPCNPHERERNYTICFATFSVLMGCALIAATQFRFDYDYTDDSIQMKPVQNGPQSGAGQTIGLQDGVAAWAAAEGEKPPEPPKSTVFAQTTRKLPEWFSVIRTFATVRYGAFLYVTWFMGFGIGLVFTFLFWHLQDLGGTPTLFGVASVINHISEIFAYFFSFKFIKQIGHVKVLCIGLIGNICRFLYISWLRNPWWVLPFEFVQGITHAAVWAACCSYITQATPSNLRTSAQGVLQGLHHGLGRGCGAIIGGIFVNYFGTQITFRGYGFACLIVLILFVFINYYKKDRGFSNFQDEQEPEMVMEETSHLAPHGVPSNPMARSLSKQHIPELDKGQQGGGNGYGGVAQQPNKTAGGFLDLPDNSGGYYGGGGTNYADFNMNTTSRGLTRGSLAAAFNPKGLLATASSPEGTQPYAYGSIRKEFQAYREALSDVESGDSKLLSAPQPKTSVYAPQPYAKEESLEYDW